MTKKKRTPTKPVAVFDTETCNLKELKRSVPVTYQLGVCFDELEDLDARDIRAFMFRAPEPVYDMFDTIALQGKAEGYVPVVMVHNLAYDIHFLMAYINLKYEQGYAIDCCFKSSIKPLSIKIKDKDGNGVLIFWDTLTFSGKSLAKMGKECGYLKATGEWDYGKIRHVETPITEEEEHYALQDVRVPFVWLHYWHELNPEVPLDRFGDMILTKTSVVRYKCKILGGRENFHTSKGKKITLYKGYSYVCKQELPANEACYNLMIRATSAGWTFTGSRGAGRLYTHAFKYDATSMHPSHMVSHMFPQKFDLVKDMGVAKRIFNHVIDRSIEKVVNNWIRPFDYAFNARVRFINIRPKTGSVFARDGVMLHGQSLFSDYKCVAADLDDESSVMEFNAVNESGYANTAVGAEYEFGKLVSAKEITIALNELNAWVHAQVYEWDSLEVLEMSASCSFYRPPDYVFMAVHTMLERKKIVKDAMHGLMIDERPEWFPAAVWVLLEMGKTEHEDVKAFYKNVKADLNSLYGMFATNEFKQSMVYDPDAQTFGYDGVRGFDKEVENPKAWYNFGLRIAAWSRVQQCVAIQRIDTAGLVDTLINGDTDSFCWQGTNQCSDSKIMQALNTLHTKIKRAIKVVTMRYPGADSETFEGLGEYMIDCTPTSYCAVANKRYAYTTAEDDQVHIHVASAGVPNSSIKAAIAYELEQGNDLAKATALALGYGCVYVGDLSGSKYKSAPAYNEYLSGPVIVTDYTGREYTYPVGGKLGIYLADTDKGLGIDYIEDQCVTFRHAGLPITGIRYYERVSKTNEPLRVMKWE